tara:strand:- start:522 stop:1703 length:1182 start_codon:yes stop_codon:yes gene_type:complete
MKNKITFVIPSRNNLEFLQLAYKSIRRLNNVHEILVLNDASTDGTQEWIDSLDDDDVIVYHNSGPERIGIVGMFDKGIEMARTDIIMAFHADMIAGPNLDENILKHLERGKVVSATRVEPPLHPPGPEKITMNFHFGPDAEAYNFDWNGFFSWAENIGLKDTKTTEGVFAPWCMYKEDFLAINGHDELFAPQSKEDSDIFNRMQLAGYKFVQPWDALVYHFTSRGSRFNKYSGGAAGKDSDEWLYTTTKNMRNFIRKWGTVVLNDSLMKPIIPPKYNNQFIIENGTSSLLQVLEPWCDNINIDIDKSEIEKYIKEEQPNTIIDLTKRINQNVSNDIQITFDGNKFTQNSFNIIQQLSTIIESNEIEAGEFEIEIFKIKVNKVKTYEHTLISAD